VVLPKNAPIFWEFSTNKLATIDRTTMTIHERWLPSASARLRRIALAPDGRVGVDVSLHSQPLGSGGSP
jgi:hypothetical protein